LFRLLPVLGILLLSAVSAVVYVSPVRTGLLLLGLLLLAALLEIWIKKRVHRAARGCSLRSERCWLNTR